MTAVHDTRPLERFTARERAVLFVLCGAIFLEGIDVAMLNVALPAIRDDLGLSTGALSAVVSAYVLGYGGFMLLGGAAADRFGRRRMLLTWMGVFAVFSGLGGLATDGWLLLAARFVTGVAAAFMTPAGLSLITTNIGEGPRRNKALIIYGATGAAGFSLGLVAGGLLTSVSWRWVFFAPVVMSTVLLVVASRVVRDAAPQQRRTGRFDVPGAVVLTTGAVLVVYAVTRLEHPGRGSALTAGLLVAGALLVTLFLRIEQTAEAPLVRPGLLGVVPLRRANLTALGFAASFFAFQFLLTLYLQELLGWSALATGLAMLPAALDLVLGPTLTPRLVARFGTDRVIVAGLLAAAAGYAVFLGAGLDWTYAAMFPSMVLLGLAFALAYGPITIAATNRVADHEQGVAGGLVNTSFQFGAALGVSAASALHATALDGVGVDAELGAIRAGMLVPVVAAIAAALVAARALRRRVDQAAVGSCAARCDPTGPHQEVPCPS